MNSDKWCWYWVIYAVYERKKIMLVSRGNAVDHMKYRHLERGKAGEKGRADQTWFMCEWQELWNNVGQTFG